MNPWLSRGLVPLDEEYQGPSWWPITRLADIGRSAGIRRVVALGLAVIAASVVTGALNVTLNWNALPVTLGPLRFDVTLYPPFVLSLLAAIWIGPTWGMVPAYAANLTGAILAGLPWPLAILFALAGALEVLIFWGSMVTLNIDPELRRPRDLGRFLVVSLIAPVTGSLAALLWNTARGLDYATGQRIWSGWVVGDILQALLVAAPLLHFAGPSTRAWIDRQFAAPPRYEVTYTRTAVLAVGTFVIMAFLVFLGIYMLEDQLGLDPALTTASGERLTDRIAEMKFFLGMLVAALTVTTGVFATVLARMGERQKRLSRRESLTGCFNRRAFYELFPREADRARRLGQGISLLFLDLDHFKRINDRHGHEVGDRVLQQIAARLQGIIRETDLLFRWGGEEFVILLSHTSPGDSGALAERIRGAVAERAFLEGEEHPPIRLTVSLGTAGTESYPADPDALLARADAACYRAKQAGRDRVEAESAVA
jgi:diguanylate cyclase (GGDEF)-like protein